MSKLSHIHLLWEIIDLTVIRKNWTSTVPGTCRPPEILTGLAYAAVSIVTDWVFAITPICLLWNVQMKLKIKIPVFIMLSLGIL